MLYGVPSLLLRDGPEGLVDGQEAPLFLIIVASGRRSALSSCSWTSVVQTLRKLRADISIDVGHLADQPTPKLCHLLFAGNDLAAIGAGLGSVGREVTS